MIEPSSGGAGFGSSMFVVLKCTGGLQPILNLKCFKCYMYVPSFKMPTIRHVWQLIQHGDYAFSIDLQDAYLQIPITKHHHHFLQFVWHNVPHEWKVLPFGLATAPWVFTSLTKPILSSAITRVSLLLSIWMTSWFWFSLSGQVGGLAHFCVLII